MAHFAELNEDNVVKQVIVVNNDVVNDLPFPESEPLGVEFCKSLFGQDTRWVQTSINANFRKTYGQVGFFYDSGLDEFVDPMAIIPDYEVS